MWTEERWRTLCLVSIVLIISMRRMDLSHSWSPPDLVLRVKPVNVQIPKNLPTSQAYSSSQIINCSCSNVFARPQNGNVWKRHSVVFWSKLHGTIFLASHGYVPVLLENFKQCLRKQFLQDNVMMFASSYIFSSVQTLRRVEMPSSHPYLFGALVRTRQRQKVLATVEKKGPKQFQTVHVSKRKITSRFITTNASGLHEGCHKHQEYPESAPHKANTCEMLVVSANVLKLAVLGFHSRIYTKVWQFPTLRQVPFNMRVAGWTGTSFPPTQNFAPELLWWYCKDQ